MLVKISVYKGHKLKYMFTSHHPNTRNYYKQTVQRFSSKIDRNGGGKKRLIILKLWIYFLAYSSPTSDTFLSRLNPVHGHKAYSSEPHSSINRLSVLLCRFSGLNSKHILFLLLKMHAIISISLMSSSSI